MYAGRFYCPCAEESRLARERPERARTWPYPWAAERGCRGDAIDKAGRPRVVARWNGEALRRCPVAILPRWTHGVLRSWEQYTQHGVLPGPGGQQDQPAMWLDAMDLLSQTVAECRRENQADRARMAGLPIVKDGVMVDDGSTGAK